MICERYGFIKMEKTARTKKPIAKAVDFDIMVST